MPCKGLQRCQVLPSQEAPQRLQRRLHLSKHPAHTSISSKCRACMCRCPSISRQQHLRLAIIHSCVKQSQQAGRNGCCGAAAAVCLDFLAPPVQLC